MKPAAARGFIVFLIAALSCCCEKTVNRGIFAPSRLEHIRGQDGVSSIPFDDNTTLWTFADTIIPLTESNSPVEGRHAGAGYTMISNSLAWTEKISTDNVADIRFSYYMENGNVAQFIKNSAGESVLHHRLWALDGVRIGNRVYVYYAHVYVPNSSKFLDFTVRNIGLAIWDVPSGWKPGSGISFRRAGALFPEGRPFFGAAVMHKDGYVYLAGHSKRGQSHPLSFARVSEDAIDEPGAYEYLDSTGAWSKDFLQCGYFFGDVAGECSLAFNEYFGVFDVFYARMFSGDTVHVQFSSFSRLPGAAGHVIYKQAPVKKGSMWPYSAKEIFSEGRSTFLIYIDPVQYQPVLLEYRRQCTIFTETGRQTWMEKE